MRKRHGLDSVLSDCCILQARKLAALQQRHGALPDGGKSVGISVGASMLVASVAGCVNVLLTNPICEHMLVTGRACRAWRHTAVSLACQQDINKPLLQHAWSSRCCSFRHATSSACLLREGLRWQMVSQQQGAVADMCASMSVPQGW
jgi:hypothetical protein